jgi:hypothetical protein
VFETRLDLHSKGSGGHSQSSSNTASHGRGGFTRGRGGRGGNSGDCGRGDKPRNKFPPCQLYGRTNHPVFKSYKWFDPTYMGEEKSVNPANFYGVDSNQYADSGATDHVTGDLDKLVVRETYNGNDQIYTASGSSMPIKHVGKSVIRTPYHDVCTHIITVIAFAIALYSAFVLDMETVGCF